MIKRALPLLALMLSACLTPTTDPQRLPAGEWGLDPDHASVTWSVQHMGLSKYTGRFDRIDASLAFDPERPDLARLVAIIEADSISTGDPEFDRQLADDWLQAERAPQLTFRSTAIEVKGATSGRVTGTLTLRGQTRPAVMDVTFYGGAFNPLTRRDTIGFAGDLVINRTEFGVGNLPAAIVGHEVRIHIEAEFQREGETDE